MQTERKITAFEARTHLGEILDFVRYSKTPCLIERHGKAVAAIIDIEVYKQHALNKQYSAWIATVTEQIKTHYQPEKIILFGSAARGELRDGSDIDIFVLKETNKRKLDRIDEVLEFIDPAIPVELHIFTPGEIKERLKLNDFFIKEILNSGKLLYERKK